jgi:hypothetical protein
MIDREHDLPIHQAGGDFEGQSRLVAGLGIGGARTAIFKT